jgi:predicted HTH transcriptional regulator
MPDQTQLIELIRLGREQRLLEYKGSAPWESIKNKIIRTALAMANCRDGGTVIIGVPQRAGLFVPEGVASDHLVSYDADDIQAAINRHADPYVRTELHRVAADDKMFLALIVHQFDEIPVVCKKDGIDLREGAVYTRSYRMPESCEVRSQTEMREIIDLAVDKAVRGFIRRIHAAGATLEEIESHIDRFAKQLGDL